MTYYANFDNLKQLIGVGFNKIIIDQYGSSEVYNTEVPEELYQDYILTPDKYIAGEKDIKVDVIDNEEEETTHKEIITVPYPVIDPDYEEKQAQKREKQFNKDFFNTSLGYIRRKVHMKTGETKDFLTDLLPLISMALTVGQTVDIITYSQPDFTQEEVDWGSLQTVKKATMQFVQECFLLVNKDFTGV